MKRVVVGSVNPVKLEAVRLAFEGMFPEEQFDVQGVVVPSGVPDQPGSSAETLKGANNRALACESAEPLADYWVGIEGGVDHFEPAGKDLFTFAWVVILDRERLGKARTGGFMLPPKVAEYIREGLELGDADDLVFGTTNSKQVNGAVGILTGDVLMRTSLYSSAVQLALIPFRNPALYPPNRRA